MQARFKPHRPSAPMVMSSLALFVSLGGAGYAATGDNFILGQANTATTASSLTAPVSGDKALQVTNTSTGTGSTALGLTAASGHAPFTVNSTTKVAKLNADALHGLDSTAFLRNRVPLSLTGSLASGGVIAATNTGTGNGVQGISNGTLEGGVYGENDAGGIGVFGRSNQSTGTGVYGEAL